MISITKSILIYCSLYHFPATFDPAPLWERSQSPPLLHLITAPSRHMCYSSSRIIWLLSYVGIIDPKWNSIWGIDITLSLPVIVSQYVINTVFLCAFPLWHTHPPPTPPLLLSLNNGGEGKPHSDWHRPSIKGSEGRKEGNAVAMAAVSAIRARGTCSISTGCTCKGNAGCPYSKITGYVSKLSCLARTNS